MALSPPAFAVNRDRVISETIEGEVVMIDVATGHYFCLDDTAAEVWELIEAGATCPEMVSTLSERHGASAALVESALSPFLGQLQEAGLVVTVDRDGDRAGVAQLAPTLAQPQVGGFAPPRLETYTDMAHIMVLDPISDVDPERGWPRERRAG